VFEFWSAVGVSTLARNACIMALMVSVACGVVGSFVVARRITYIAAAIAHCILAGMGAAQYAVRVFGWTWLTPLHGAYAAAILAALVIGWAALRASEREDTVISAVWAVGMAVGILFIYKTPGYQEDLMTYLVGNILLVSEADIWTTLALNIVIVGVTWLFFPQLEAVCFDEEFARVRGLRVEVYYALLLVLTAITVVMLAMVVGIVMVIALLTLPAAVAGRATGSLGRTMALAVLLCAGLNVGGLWISYVPDLPAGAVIILLGGAVYLGTLVFGGIRGRRSAVR